MLLVHIPRMTNRLGYTINVLCRHILKTEFEITADADLFVRYEGPKMCYGRQKVGDAFFVRACDLLFQTTIEEQSPRCFKYEDLPVLYPVHNTDSEFPFDILASVFFCLSRYEQYLPHITDIHGRFPASESLAYKEHFLMTAIVDRWALMLAERLKRSSCSMRPLTA